MVSRVKYAYCVTKEVGVGILRDVWKGLSKVLRELINALRALLSNWVAVMGTAFIVISLLLTPFWYDKIAVWEPNPQPVVELNMWVLAFVISILSVSFVLFALFFGGGAIIELFTDVRKRLKVRFGNADKICKERYDKVR